MIFSNPYFLILILMMGVALAHANYMDGAAMPPRTYSFMHTLASILLNFTLIYCAVQWAATH